MLCYTQVIYRTNGYEIVICYLKYSLWSRKISWLEFKLFFINLYAVILPYNSGCKKHTWICQIEKVISHRSILCHQQLLLLQLKLLFYSNFFFFLHYLLYILNDGNHFPYMVTIGMESRRGTNLREIVMDKTHAI